MGSVVGTVHVCHDVAMEVRGQPVGALTLFHLWFPRIEL